VLLPLLVFPLCVRAQYGYGPITSEDGTNSTSETPLLADQSQDLQGAGFILEYSLIGIAIESIFYGILVTLYIFSTRILVRKGLYKSSYRGMLIVTSIMFAASTSYWGVSLAITVKNIRDLLINHVDASIAERFDIANTSVLNLYLAEVYLPMVNYLLSDAVVVWRAWTLWPHKKRFLFPLPIFLLFGSFVTMLIVGAMKVRAKSHDSDELEIALSDTQIVSWSLSLGTNFFATALIAWKTWVFRKNITQHIGESDGRMRVEKVLSLLVESGVLYCFTQIALVVSWFVPLPNTTAWASDTFGAAAVQLAAIYPTVIIVLVSLNNVTLNVPRTIKLPTNEASGVGSHLTFAENPSATLSAQISTRKTQFTPISWSVFNSLHLFSRNDTGSSEDNVALDLPSTADVMTGDMEKQ